MKKIIYICMPILLIVLCMTCILFLESDSSLVAKSEKAVEKYGGIYIDENGSIISLYPYHGKKAFSSNLATVTKLAQDSDLPVYLAIPPRKMDVLKIPEDVDTKPTEALFRLIQKDFEKSGGIYVDLLSAMTGENLYFATDHHWTSKGAYLAYREIISALGKTPVDENDFTVKTVCTTYRGSDYNKLDKDTNYTLYDTIRLYYPKDYDSYVTTIVGHPYDSQENTEVIGGMYHMESLESWDPYTVYFKGNTPYITIRNGEDRQTLMIVRDSFASALAPFFAIHYDVVMIDPRFYPQRLSNVVERENVSLILVLENMGSFTENTIKFTY